MKNRRRLFQFEQYRDMESRIMDRFRPRIQDYEEWFSRQKLNSRQSIDANLPFNLHRNPCWVSTPREKCTNVTRFPDNAATDKNHRQEKRTHQTKIPNILIDARRNSLKGSHVHRQRSLFQKIEQHDENHERHDKSSQREIPHQFVFVEGKAATYQSNKILKPPAH